jgi:predicted CXXCH cytochrome family protein
MNRLCKAAHRVEMPGRAAFDNGHMPDMPDDEPARIIECQMCHQPTPSRQMVVMGGRRLCLGCASAWFDDEDDGDGREVRQKG